MEKGNQLVRIALIGPESTGKSVLCEQLAAHYQTAWVREFARHYLPTLSRPYQLNDIVWIGKKQSEQESELAEQANQCLFIDTEYINLKIWCEEVFQEVPDWIRERCNKPQYDLYLLTFPDIPWQSDPLRENEHRRDYLFMRYKEALDNIAAIYSIVSGTGNDRFNTALAAVEKFLKSPQN